MYVFAFPLQSRSLWILTSVSPVNSTKQIPSIQIHQIGVETARTYSCSIQSTSELSGKMYSSRLLNGLIKSYLSTSPLSGQTLTTRCSPSNPNRHFLRHRFSLLLFWCRGFLRILSVRTMSIPPFSCHFTLAFTSLSSAFPLENRMSDYFRFRALQRSHLYLDSTFPYYIRPCRILSHRIQYETISWADHFHQPLSLSPLEYNRIRCEFSICVQVRIEPDAMHD